MSSFPVIRRRWHAAAWLLTALLLGAAAATPGISETGEPPLPNNFGMMEEWLYRGAVPDTAQLRTLAGLGIGTVIDLRWTTERGYGTGVRQLGMAYIQLPIRPRSVPTEEDLQRFFSLLESETNLPVYVHCRKGKHRTGLLLALYRVLRQRTSREDALAEMQAYRFGRGHRRMVNYFHQRTTEPAVGR